MVHIQCRSSESVMLLTSSVLSKTEEQDMVEELPKVIRHEVRISGYTGTVGFLCIVP